ncbi:diguanylate cyclase with GAF sensor [Desulfatibacillum aliphaticivorans]|uniref:diguanylate cyclase n=2 Tax=Desulfatibacillum aliphaticivorans TaxID=218208 RepID=B8FB40_DESAL|nr:diguanylate cyclase with GAF sensor [Desulfatibacillum aliphaticivorans]
MTNNLSEQTKHGCNMSPNIFCRIGRILTSSLDPKVVFERVMALVGEHFNPRNWSLLLVDKDTGRLRFEIVMGVDATKLRRFYLECGEGIVGWVCQNAKPLVIENVREDARFSPRVDELLGFKTHSVVCVPLVNGGNKVVGAIELINKLSPEGKGDDGLQSFTQEDMEILNSIGAFTGIAAENAFLHQRVREMAMIDSLTGINNRLYFNEAIRREVDRVKRYKKTLCMLFMDVNGLKGINDRLGHLIGDQVLVQVANVLKQSVRKSDILARYGGDEFVVLMPFAGQEDGDKLALRIQDLLEQWNQDPVIPGVSLGLSIGVHAARAENMDSVLREADLKMYEQKILEKKPEELVSEEEMRRFLTRNPSLG